MAHRIPSIAAALFLTAALAACAEDGEPSPTPQAEETIEPSPRTSYLPEGDLPAAVTLEDVGGRTIAAKPFADFAVAAGTGIWVSGVAPGIVRYDAGGSVTARATIKGVVTQALEESGGEVLVPSRYPNDLVRIDAATGRVTARVALPSSPVMEGVLGAIGDTAYVLVDEVDVGQGPVIAVVRGDRVIDSLAAPEDAFAVRAAFGALWVPTSEDAMERYDLATEEWRSIAVGPDPRFLDAGYGAVWVMNQGDGSVTRIDAETGDAEAIPVTGVFIGGGALTIGAGAVWLRTASQVARLDPETRRVTHVLDLPPGSGSVAATEHSLLITNHDHLAVHLVPLPLPG